jgi:hypothetical protein
MDGPNEADRADFAKRLSLYGLDPDAVLAQTFNTVASTVTRLHTGADSMLRPVILRTNNFNDVNRWIGVSDRVFDEIEPFAEPPHPSKLKALRKGGAPLLERAAARSYEQRATAARTDIGRIEAAQQPAAGDVRISDDTEIARDVARAFLYGDARKLQGHAVWLSTKFPAVEVAIWPILNVVVKSGSILEFGPGPHVLVACSVTIEAGGKIRARGNLKIDATMLQRTLPMRQVLLNPALEYLGNRMGVNRG